MKRYRDWRDLPDDPNRVGDEDYKPYSPPKEIDEDEAYERGKEREWQEENRCPSCGVYGCDVKDCVEGISEGL